ncbi:MAG: helix-turn-helix domain-containing protein [Terriglobia bacterium]
MFDSPHSPRVFERLLNSEQAAAIIKVHPKTLQRYARHGIVSGLRVGKLWRFRASDLIPSHFENNREDLDVDAQAQYAEVNHSCPQPDRR